ncbi:MULTISPECIES: biotin--[acetyl-CoA-carboxylase] ligase [Pontibacillus]|uniref:Bifunctional ligase/repressor BirA n=1 Tax=Pontibacillus chungwhensis TaxID=265426 RepID=A0ABY8URR5_9BACI|nr:MULTISPECIES: biotin--[acetyl-CoA-carboxylase] ligase [Pontibacillus]MCD5322968.1 biotin--[acetyl-CoA-carboxylase] ligase [Pontibacillus sp. HN14]WIF96362.1 biotin--[acetyl-CoA-carboxylase] ligase [Pontibacillus chungwhensis]
METTRGKLIEILSNHPDQYLSGQKLSEQLNISRPAVWKHMKELEKDGYGIEAAPRKGYKIVNYPDKVSENTLSWGLNTAWLGQEMIHKQSVTSTQLIAHQEAQLGAAHGTLIIADEQTRGRGRLNRTWHSQKGDGIWMSMILRPKFEPHKSPQITLLAATVLAEVFKKHCGIAPQIKWPNDILTEGKKLSGILTELQAEHDQINYIVLGIGINVNHSSDQFPEDLKDQATSLKVETGQEWELKSLIQNLLSTFEKRYEEFVEEGFRSVKLRWEAFGYRIGEYVTITTHQHEWNALIMGIEHDGALKVRDEDGKEHVLYSAEIKWRRGEK